MVGTRPMPSHALDPGPAGRHVVILSYPGPDVTSQRSPLLKAHEITLRQAHEGANAADGAGNDRTNDLLVSNVICTNEPQVWFIGEHLAATPLQRPNR